MSQLMGLRSSDAGRLSVKLYAGRLSVKLFLNQMFIKMVFIQNPGNKVTFYTQMVPTGHASLIKWWPTSAILCYS